ncbi:MAG: Dabb family protein [Planctomycetaceae bacterium]|jgi:quinol monooxygenase YgiN|nr:Dabb family protein [Planctomycetaceae bacterium]MCE2814589.1 Dabb family protein [Planctomycetaceae bacterium]
MTDTKQQLSHMVYFTLHDASANKVQELLSACHKYLTGHPGTVYFSVGTLNRDLARPVNDHGYDVVLNIVFESRQAHDEYQTEPKHLKFIEEQKPNWKQVRVFDSDLVPA